MKIHLQIPGTNDTMCGRSIESSTSQPAEVTCSHCRGYYNYNPKRYLSALVEEAVKKALERKHGRNPEDTKHLMTCAVPICNSYFEWTDDSQHSDAARLREKGWRFHFGKWICANHENEKVEIPIGTRPPRRRAFEGLTGIFPPFPREPVEGWADEVRKGESDSI